MLMETVAKKIVLMSPPLLPFPVLPIPAFHDSVIIMPTCDSIENVNLVAHSNSSSSRLSQLSCRYYCLFRNGRTETSFENLTNYISKRN